jgi:hypothetical protein
LESLADLLYRRACIGSAFYLTRARLQAASSFFYYFLGELSAAIILYLALGASFLLSAIRPGMRSSQPVEKTLGF